MIKFSKAVKYGVAKFPTEEQFMAGTMGAAHYWCTDCGFSGWFSCREGLDQFVASVDDWECTTCLRLKNKPEQRRVQTSISA